MARKRNHSSVKNTPGSGHNDDDNEVNDDKNTGNHVKDDLSQGLASPCGQGFHHCWRCFAINVLLLTLAVVVIKAVKDIAVNYFNFWFL